MTKVIFINGPPRSGKDTVGEIIKTLVPGAQTTKMAYSLKVGAHAMFRAMHERLTPGTLHLALDDAAYEDTKDKPSLLFYGKTPREAYIAVSELLIKPMYGEDFWGTIVAERIEANPSVPLWLITDSGFEPETRPIIELVGKENCTLLKMVRDGCNFSSDSRDYINLPGIIPTLVINNGILSGLENLVRNLLENLEIA